MTKMDCSEDLWGAVDGSVESELPICVPREGTDLIHLSQVSRLPLRLSGIIYVEP